MQVTKWKYYVYMAERIGFWCPVLAHVGCDSRQWGGGRYAAEEAHLINDQRQKAGKFSW